MKVQNECIQDMIHLRRFLHPLPSTRCWRTNIIQFKRIFERNMKQSKQKRTTAQYEEYDLKFLNG